jgi:hypothetical protein
VRGRRGFGLAAAFAVAWTLASCSAEPTSSATASPTVHVEFRAFERVVALQFSEPIDAARIDFFGG